MAALIFATAIAVPASPPFAQIAVGPPDEESGGPAQPAETPDEWITTKVKIALLAASGVPATRVNVDTVDGLVTLHGSVGTASEKADAEVAARGVEGMRDVRNLLQVVDEKAEDGVAVDDDALKTRVEEALLADPALSESQIKVDSVNKGVVLLSGTAVTLSNHLRALETAAAVPGVVRVATQIVSPDAFVDAELWRDGSYDLDLSKRSAASDLWITSEVKVRLFETNQTPTYDINVDTENAVVTLFGVVDSERARDAVTAEAAKIPGVKKVVNALQIVPPGEEAAVAEKDEVINAAIVKRLAAKSQLADATIAVDVKNGVARVSGTVKGQSDRLTALSVARATPGVRGLVSELELAR
jgi:hyperosmotically inducible protein